MKTLILVRHAKSSWQHPGLTDHDRPLNARGRRDAPIMGQRLAQRGVSPDLLITSPAVRTQATVAAIAQTIGYPAAEIQVDDELYHASVFTWLTVIRSQDDDLDCVLYCGHNPGLTELVDTLSFLHLDNVPTCGIIELCFDVSAWIDVERARLTQADFDYPKR
ncbi:MAG: histidine phosphatase family protein [Chloroflexi bacterium]|nr:histidine phosphatase family protein [Chloroflexota bacterium]MBU1748616.1 histidine phosphatase family protein [Chloroflexota bacterium]MBU1878660.1 histidine phosphatase family protein [Chloroflexota bacterium]